MTFTQLLQDHWWLFMCPAAGVALLPVPVQAALGVVAAATFVWAFRYGTKPVQTKAPVIIDAEVVECTTTQNTTE